MTPTCAERGLRPLRTRISKRPTPARVPPSPLKMEMALLRHATHLLVHASTAALSARARARGLCPTQVQYKCGAPTPPASRLDPVLARFSPMASRQPPAPRNPASIPHALPLSRLARCHPSPAPSPLHRPSTSTPGNRGSNRKKNENEKETRKSHIPQKNPKTRNSENNAEMKRKTDLHHTPQRQAPPTGAEDLFCEGACAFNARPAEIQKRGISSVP
ncbi:hypothetical protein C8R43DRAFT_373321 [Mycena crocata]|nr:hypothetical protein C8R43DRAFT_373321 [Mycena crocata]